MIFCRTVFTKYHHWQTMGKQPVRAKHTNTDNSPQAKKKQPDLWKVNIIVNLYLYHPLLQLFKYVLLKYTTVKGNRTNIFIMSSVKSCVIKSFSDENYIAANVSSERLVHRHRIDVKLWWRSIIILLGAMLPIIGRLVTVYRWHWQ